MEVAVINRELVGWLGKQAAAKATVRSGTVPAGDRDAVAAALAAGPRPASEIAPTRYGRKLTRRPQADREE